MIEFESPWFFALLPLAIIVFLMMRRPIGVLSYSSTKVIERTPRTLRVRLISLPALLVALGVAALVTALARPRSPEDQTSVSKEGIAIMMVVDLSSSMNARDLVEEDRSINRLEVVKEVFSNFVLGGGDSGQSGRPNDLIGLVTFAGYADSICPMTLDHGNLASIVADLEIVNERSEDGTAIGEGLGLAVERLRRSDAESRIAILLTDGVNNSGIVQPNQAADLAAEFGIKVYCIGAGTNGVAPMPARDVFGRSTMVAQSVEIDEKMLQSIAEKTGGQYFRAENRDALAEVYSEIDQLERTEISETMYRKYTEHFASCIAASMLLVAGGLILSNTVLRTYP